MKIGPVQSVVPEVIRDCQKQKFGNLEADIREWARLRNYFVVLLGMVKDSATISDIQAYVVVEKVMRLMRANPEPNDKVVFPGLEDIQLAVYMNTAQ